MSLDKFISQGNSQIHSVNMHMFKAQKIYQAEFSQVSHSHHNLKLRQTFYFNYGLEICKGQILKIFVFIHHLNMKFYHVNIPIFHTS